MLSLLLLVGEIISAFVHSYLIIEKRFILSQLLILLLLRLDNNFYFI